MKKLFTFAFFALLAGGLWAASPANSNPFQDDLSRLDNEFKGMSQLEQLVEERHAGYSELAAENSPLLNNVTSDNDISASLLGSAAPNSDHLLGIPGFWWGFCLGLLGILLVYILVEGEDNKRREGKKALLGCIAWVVIWTVLWFGLLASGAWWASAG